MKISDKLILLTYLISIDESYSRIKYRECRSTFKIGVNYIFVMKTNK
jgi:hypothetical protein